MGELADPPMDTAFFRWYFPPDIGLIRSAAFLRDSIGNKRTNFSRETREEDAFAVISGSFLSISLMAALPDIF